MGSTYSLDLVFTSVLPRAVSFCGLESLSFSYLESTYFSDLEGSLDSLLRRIYLFFRSRVRNSITGRLLSTFRHNSDYQNRIQRFAIFQVTEKTANFAIATRPVSSIVALSLGIFRVISNRYATRPPNNTTIYMDLGRVFSVYSDLVPRVLPSAVFNGSPHPLHPHQPLLHPTYPPFFSLCSPILFNPPLFSSSHATSSIYFLARATRIALLGISEVLPRIQRLHRPSWMDRQSSLTLPSPLLPLALYLPFRVCASTSVPPPPPTAAAFFCL